jgi:hypothetical protein
LVRKPQRKQTLGRPRRRQEYTTEMQLRVTGSEGVNWLGSWPIMCFVITDVEAPIYIIRESVKLNQSNLDCYQLRIWTLKIKICSETRSICNCINYLISTKWVRKPQFGNLCYRWRSLSSVKCMLSGPLSQSFKRRISKAVSFMNKFPHCIFLHYKNVSVCRR